MLKETITLDDTECFSKPFLDYINQCEKLSEFYQSFPSIENFESIIAERDFPAQNRSTLSQALLLQYDGFQIPPSVKDNIEKLKQSNTFTITTGHQLNIFTGPLYFIYKIVTVINTCKQLKARYPAYDFIPVYWMASEDHDFEEISYFRFQGKKIQWQTKQTGAVGRFSPSDLLDIVSSLPSGASFFKSAYEAKTLSDAVRYYVNHLFGDEGLVVTDADDKLLKKALVPIIQDDLFHHHPEALVKGSSQSLEEIGYRPQVNARQINFFYMLDNIRSRIEKTNGQYNVVDTEINFTSEELKELITSNPERFSPNVILRPLYQEIILPNLAYVGGPSELVYWLQLKAVFNYFKTPFPILLPRNFGVIQTNQNKEKWQKLGLETRDLFLDFDSVFSKWVSKNNGSTLHFDSELKQLKALESSMKNKVMSIDPTLSQHIEAINATFGKKIQKAEKKMIRAEKKKHAVRANQIKSVQESLFPNGSLQERSDNFLNFYLKDPKFIQRLLNTFDPFDFKMNLLTMD